MKGEPQAESRTGGKNNPRIEGELRIYVGRFPWKVAPLLAEAKKMFYKTGVARSGGQRKKTVTEETNTAAKSHRRNKDKKGKSKKQRKKSKKKDKKTTDAHVGEPTPTPCSTSLLHNLAYEPDWGSDNSPAEALGRDSRETGRGDAATPKTPVHANRVDGSQEPLSAGSSSGAQRPRTPSRSPSRARGQPGRSADATKPQPTQNGTAS